MAETKKEPEKILFSKEQIVSSMRYKKVQRFFWLEIWTMIKIIQQKKLIR